MDNNYRYLDQALSGLKVGLSSRQSWQVLKEVLSPRLQKGVLDLGDGIRLWFFEEGDEYGLRIENPDLPVDAYDFGRLTEIASDRRFPTNGFRARTLYGMFRLSTNVVGSLLYLVGNYLNVYPPRHERERRMELKLEESQQSLTEAYTELGRLQEVLRQTQLERDQAVSRANRLAEICRSAARKLEATKRFIKDGRFAQIRRLLESAAG